MSDIDDSKIQRFLNSKLVATGKLGEGGEGIMSQIEFDEFIKDAIEIKPNDTSNINQVLVAPL